MDEILLVVASKQDFYNEPELQALYLTRLAKEIAVGKMPTVDDIRKLTIIAQYLGILGNEIIRTKLDASHIMRPNATQDTQQSDAQDNADKNE